MIQKYGLLYAWIVACLSLIGSFYFGEIKGIEPCSLCWYQRMNIYPLVIILGIAFLKKAAEINRYVLPFAIIGLILSLYHLFIYELPNLPTLPCTGAPSCSAKNLDYSSLPPIFLSVCAFILIILFLILPKIQKTRNF